MSDIYPPSKRDANQVLQAAFDEDTQRLRTDSTATLVNASIEVDLSAADGDSVAIQDSDGDELEINPNGSINAVVSGTVAVSNFPATQAVTGTFFQATQPVSAAALPLPTGASTSALQTTGNTTLTNINNKLPTLVSSRMPVDGSGVTQPISAVSLPLPTGAATSANQTVVNNNTSPIEDFGTAGNLGAALNSAVTFTNTNGYSSISFYLTVPTGGTVIFEDSPDGINWLPCTLRLRGGDNYISSSNASGGVIGSISGARAFRVRVTVAGSAAGSVIGRVSKQVSTLEGIENGAPNEFFFDVSRGKIGGMAGSRRFARNPDIDTTKETVWAYGGIYTFATAASTWYISSSSATDTTQVITMSLLDENYVAATRTITLNGQTKTAIPGGLVLRINAAINTGSTDLTGNVYIYEDDTVVAGVPQTPSKVKTMITQTEQNSGNGFYTVPAGRTAYLVSWSANCSNGTADVTMDIRDFGRVFRNRGRRLASPSVTTEYKVFQAIPEKSDIRFEASSSTNNTIVVIDYDMILVDN